MGESMYIGVYHLDNDTMNCVENCCKKIFWDKNIRYNILEVEENLLLQNVFDIMFVNVKELIGTVKENVNRMVKNVKARIVALANDVESLLYAFKINSYQAITKDTEESEVYNIINGIVGDILSVEKIVANDGDNVRVIDTNDILYIEALGDGSIIVTGDEQVYSNKSLKSWECNLVESHFFRCHKSYLVSLNNIKKIVCNQIYFDELCSNSVPISVRKQKLMNDVLKSL